MEKGDDPYKILGVSPTATAQEIKKAYFKKCRKYHPDKATTEKEVRKYTVLMFKINDAKEILLDEVKRKRHDADVRDDANSDGDSDSKPGSAYNKHNKEFPKKNMKKEKPQPGNLGGCPYEGDMGSTPFFFNGDGSAGADARDGRDGHSGENFSMSGSDGTDANVAGHGAKACDLKIRLQTFVSEDGYFEVSVDASRGDELMDPSRDNLTSVPLKAFERVDWTACGGRGGSGGRGGNGGHGYRGKNGRDASTFPFHRCGSDGGPGGDGGNGGAGSHGGAGGRGGDVEIVLDRSDIYLLMRVAGCDPQEGVGLRLNGGAGGARGAHGRRGKSGAGGRGGSSSHYTTHHDEYRNGSYYRVEVRNTIPGGRNGPRGRNGVSPKFHLDLGEGGAPGSFQIRIRQPDGSDRLYESRYDLSFQSTKTKALSDMNDSTCDSNETFEFGETVLITACTIKNTGPMETPSQRVLITFEDEGHEVKVFRKDRILLARDYHLTPGNEGSAEQGYLRFSCPYPSTLARGTDFDPIYLDGLMKYQAHQLGPENKTDDPSKISDFQEKFKHFHKSSGQLVHMACPVENRDGIQGVHALAAEETTILEFSLFNTSRQSFGNLSETGRALFVQFYYADDQEYHIPMKNIEVRGARGKVVDIDPTLRPKGHRARISFLPGDGDTTIRLSFKLATATIRPSSRAALQADVYLQKIPTLLPSGEITEMTKKRLVQRRIFVVSCQPKFQLDCDSDVALVTTTETDPNQVSAWEYLVNERLGLRSQVYSLSRYGHLDATRDVEEGIDNGGLQQAFSKKLVIVLNEEFAAQPNLKRKERCRPSVLLKSSFDFDSSTRFLIVGGESKTVDHLSPTATSARTYRNLDEDSDDGEDDPDFERKANRKSYRSDLIDTLESERVSGFSTERINPECKVVVIKTTTVFQPGSRKIENLLQRRARNLTKWLRKRDSLRPYRVEWCPFAEPNQVDKKVLTASWEVGELRVHTGAPRFQNAMVLVGDEAVGSRSMAAVVSIQSRSMLFAALNAAPFDTKVGCFCRSLRVLAKKESETHQEICEVVNDCLVGDFLWDVANYYDGRMKTKNARDRSHTVRQLIESEQVRQIVEESLADDQLRAAVTGPLSKLVAGLKCVANSKDLKPWWSPFSRKHSVCKVMRESISLVEEHWKLLLDEDTIVLCQKEIEEKAKLHIKKARHKIFLRARGRWRAALNVIYSPKSYPPSPGFSSPTVRVRKQAEFSNGESTKIKIFFPEETASPKEAGLVRKSLVELKSFANSVHSSTQNDRGRFIQSS